LAFARATGQQKGNSLASLRAGCLWLAAAWSPWRGVAARLLWAGHRQWLMLGEAPDAGLADHAGLVELTDGWVGMTLTGAGWDAALARLTPLDIRETAFPPGTTARAELAQMQAQITRAPDGVELLLMRGFAAWAVERIGDAMKAVAARAEARESC